MPVCWSLDKIGPICRSVEDCALILEAVRGPDLEDLAVVDMPFNWNGDQDIAGLRVGYLEDVFSANGAANDDATLVALADLGMKLTPIKLPEHADMGALQMLLVDEAAAFDELVQSGRIDLLIQDRDEPEDMLMRIARLLPAVEYLQIQRLRMLMMQNMEKAMRDVDLYVAPHAGSANTSATSLTGHPAISVPNGFDEDGKPTGILFVGQLYGEANLMAVAKKYQDAHDFHHKYPALR